MAIENFKFEQFQNILCYGLSALLDLIELETTEFQNILCYGLSWICGQLCDGKRISKHLMLWFIGTGDLYPDRGINFKTSYVMVYQERI